MGDDAAPMVSTMPLAITNFNSNNCPKVCIPSLFRAVTGAGSLPPEMHPKAAIEAHFHK